MGSGIFDLVASIFISLSALGSVPELAPQTPGPVVQPATDKLLGRGSDFLL